MSGGATRIGGRVDRGRALVAGGLRAIGQAIAAALSVAGALGTALDRPRAGGAVPEGLTSGTRAAGWGRVVSLGSITRKGRRKGHAPDAASDAEDRAFAARPRAHRAWVLERQSPKARFPPEDGTVPAVLPRSDEARLISDRSVAAGGGRRRRPSPLKEPPP